MLLQNVLHIVQAELAALDVARSLSVAILLRYNELDEIGKLPLDPLHYQDAQTFFLASQAVALVKKSRFLTGKGDLESQAISQWRETEASCFHTNRFLSGIPTPYGTDSLGRYIRTARRKLQEILGRSPNPMDLSMRFGPGATMSNPSRRSTVPDKMSSRVTLTARAMPYILPFARTAWSRAVQKQRLELEIVHGNTFFTVPKDFSKHRTCAKEPSLNVAFQMAIGRKIRSRLLRSGIDLERGQDVHRKLARSASLDGSLATIDLSNASDCIASELVRVLMPPDWFELLDRARSPKTLVDGRWVLLEKFSSMGNGFTFELETLIFLVLIESIDSSLKGGVNVFVYGDDIIVPIEFSRAVLGALRMFGFQPNSNKTFITGPFRESCGGDFFEGEDVRPFFLKELPHDPAGLITLANGYRRSLEKLTSRTKKAAALRVWFGILDCIPSHIRSCRGPSELGDLVITDHESKWCTRTRNSIRYIKVWRPKETKKVFLDMFDSEVAMASLLYGVVLSGNEKNDKARYIVPRDGVLSYDVGWVPFS